MEDQFERLPTVVVIGGGGAGAPIVRGLSTELDPTKYEIILINCRPYFTHLVGCIRMIVSEREQLEDRILIPFDTNFVNGNGSLVVGTVMDIEEERRDGGGVVILDTGQRVQYDVLVMAPGSVWEGPLAMPNTFPELMDWLDGWRARIKKSDEIVLIGGGPVAIEYAGEIKDVWPHKKVTIVHKHSMLLNKAYPAAWREDVERRVRKRGVRLVLGDYVEWPGQDTGYITTRNGRVLYADVVIPCRGVRPNTDFLASLENDALTKDGTVRIRPTLQLRSHPRMFAAGDVIDYPEEKQVGKCYNHAAVVVANVKAVLENRCPSTMYKGSYEMISISIGKNHGASYFGVLWGFTFGNFVSAIVKSKGLLIESTRRRMGLLD